MVIIEEEDYLAHYGILRRSGRYPWGSGNNVPQRSRSFLDWIRHMKNQGLTEAEIAKGVGMTVSDLRATNSIARNAHKQAQISKAQALKDKGYSNVAIGKKMELNESSVRALLAPGEKDKVDVLTATSNVLRN